MSKLSTTERGSTGYLALPAFCFSSTEILVLPAKGECPNTYPRSWSCMDI